MEYKEFAKYYDIFYQKKDYEKEVGFLMNFIKTKLYQTKMVKKKFICQAMLYG